MFDLDTKYGACGRGGCETRPGVLIERGKDTSYDRHSEAIRVW